MPAFLRLCIHIQPEQAGKLHCELAEGEDVVGFVLISIPGTGGGLKGHFLPL